MNHIARKRFGQNFLHDPHVIDRIVAVIKAKPGQHMVEIGPGQGALTKPLLAILGEMDVIEIDRDLVGPLAENLASIGTLRIHRQDALKSDLRTLANHFKLRVVGNLPYNISTPLLFHLIDQLDVIEDMHFMLQKEVVDRMVAMPDTDDYGRLSVMVQYHCSPVRLLNVGPGAFRPAPKVDSAVIRLQPHFTPPVAVANYPLFANIVNRAFMQRRKTLRNALSGVATPEEMESVDISPTARGETLSLEKFSALANAVNEKGITPAA